MTLLLPLISPPDGSRWSSGLFIPILRGRTMKKTPKGGRTHYSYYFESQTLGVKEIFLTHLDLAY